MGSRLKIQGEKQKMFKDKIKDIKCKISFSMNRILTLRKSLLKLFGVCVVSVILNDVYLYDKVELFPGGAVLWDIYYKLCLSFMGGFIFYFINVHLTLEKTKVKMFKYIDNKVTTLYNLQRSLHISLVLYSKTDQNKASPLSIENINLYCRKINPHNPLTMQFPFEMLFDNWFDVFNFIEIETKRIILDLFNVKECLDSDFLQKLTNIEYVIEKNINITRGDKNVKLGNKTLEVWSNAIYTYMKLCNELKDYRTEKYKCYEDEFIYLSKK